MMTDVETRPVAAGSRWASGIYLPEIVGSNAKSWSDGQIDVVERLLEGILTANSEIWLNQQRKREPASMW
jgi:hypothetical protein